jgi:hypothetical protein
MITALPLTMQLATAAEQSGRSLALAARERSLLRAPQFPEGRESEYGQRFLGGEGEGPIRLCLACPMPRASPIGPVGTGSMIRIRVLSMLCTDVTIMAAVMVCNEIKLMQQRGGACMACMIAHPGYFTTACMLRCMDVNDQRPSWPQER